MRAVTTACVILFLSLVAVAAASASEGFDDLAAFLKSNDGNITTYLTNSPVAYSFTTDEIIYMNNNSISPRIINEAIYHGRKLGASVPTPDGFNDLVQFLKANDEAVTVYISNSPAAYNFTMDEIVYLNNNSVTPRIINEALKHGKQLRALAVPVAPVIVQSSIVVAPAPDQTNLSFFYDALAPHGEWLDVDGVSMWRPRAAIADPNWRPYCDAGNWVYTDAGWAWHSEYSWGWAPFHYGRWAHHAHYGWVWAPDHVWSPAWVSWRTSDTHYGWAPLPPAAHFEAGIGFHIGGDHAGIELNFGLTERDYNFVPCERICEPKLSLHIIPQTRVSVVYNNTTIIQNNITYNDNRVIVKGPAIEHVRAATSLAIPVVHIADASVQTGQAIHGSTLSANTFTVYRPAIQNSAPITSAVVAARKQAAEQKHETTNAIKVERIENKSERTTERRDANFDAKQKVLDAKTEAHDVKKEETASETAARIKAREVEEARVRAAADAEAAARKATRETHREAAEVKREESPAEIREKARQTKLATEGAEREKLHEKLTPEQRKALDAQRAYDAAHPAPAGTPATK